MNHSFLTKNVIASDIEVKHAKGATFFAENNKKYLDFSAQTLNINAPIEKPEKPLVKQLEKYNYTSSYFKNEPFLALSEKIISLAPPGFSKINLQLNSGADANESAFKRVRLYRKKPYILSFYWSNLGESCETLKANGRNTSAPFFGGSSYFIHLTPPFFGLKNENQVLGKLELLFKFRDDIAAIMIEPIMINAGVYGFSKFFLKSLRELCNTHHISLIFDEVKTGFGWLGTLFAFEYLEIIPDIITIGNGLASGFPLAGVLMKKEYDVLEHGYDERLYGGHPVASQIALDHIQHIEKATFMQDIQAKNKIMAKLLTELERNYKHVIKQVRIYGLIAGIECINSQTAETIHEICWNKGLLLRKSMNGTGETIIIRPPIIVEKDEIQEAFTILQESIKKLGK